MSQKQSKEDVEEDLCQEQEGCSSSDGRNSSPENESAELLDSKKGNDTITGMKRLSAANAPVLDFELVDDKLAAAGQDADRKAEKTPERTAQERSEQPRIAPGKQLLENGHTARTKEADSKEPLTRDSEGRISKVRYPDGSSRRFIYNGKDLSEIIKYDSEGRVLSSVKPTRSTSYEVKTDGTLEARHYNVSESAGEAIYNRQGKEIGRRVTEFREQTLVKSIRPDGSESVKREYPGGGSREVISKNGKAFEYVFKSADGSTDTWKRDGNTDNWYRSSDTQKKDSWTGSVEMKDDGRLLEYENSGKLTEISAAGLRGVYPDKAPWKKDLLSIADTKITDKKANQQFKEDMEMVEKRVRDGKYSASEAAELYKNTYRLLSMQSQKGVSEANMIVLARQVINQAGRPDGLDQGPYPNCNVGAPEVRLNNKHPGAIAKLTADLAISGKYTDTKGNTVDISESLTPADEKHTKVPPGELNRSYASQLFHLASINLEMKSMFPNENLKYVQKASAPGDNGARLMDYSKNPPAEVYGFENGKPVHESKPVLVNGKQAVDGNLQPQKTTPLNAPGLSIQNSVNLMEKITGRTVAGAAIGHYEQVGGPQNWILDYVALSPHVQKDARIPFFKTEQDLDTLLTQLKNQGKMPVVLEVNSGSGFLRKQVEAAEGKTMGGEGGSFGGGHVLCISDYDPQTKKVQVDNTWGTSRDKLGKDAVTLKDVVDISRADPKLQAEAKQYNQDLQSAYAAWCRQNNKTHGKDFPKPDEGRAFFLKWREEMRRAAENDLHRVPFGSY